MAARSYGQYCGVTNAVELVGERWAMLIVRDLLVGPRRYTDLKQGLPRIPTNILSTRLKELQDAGVVRRVPLMNCGLVYELTPYGRELEDIVLALGRWGFAARWATPVRATSSRRTRMTMAFRTAFRADAAADLPAGRLRGAHRRRRAARARRRRRRCAITQLAPPAPPVGGRLPAGEPDVVIAAGPGIRHVISGELTPGEAIDQEVLAVVSGDALAARAVRGDVPHRPAVAPPRVAA